MCGTSYGGCPCYYNISASASYGLNQFFVMAMTSSTHEKIGEVAIWNRIDNFLVYRLMGVGGRWLLIKSATLKSRDTLEYLYMMNVSSTYISRNDCSFLRRKEKIISGNCYIIKTKRTSHGFQYFVKTVQAG